LDWVDPEEARTLFWKDTLTRRELDDVERITSMPTAMAIGYAFVTLRREIDLLHDTRGNGVWKPALRQLGIFVSGAIAALIAALAGTDQLPKP
jgi:hypothetical protein